ncbi:MAG: STN domain-containing protein [Sphingomonas phyllosphaerae]|uniref:STN domain-containing protein n=1 Tax=Sphingomonas phyllosphaerae TaxID=257003 RepID=UPI002FF6F74A
MFSPIVRPLALLGTACALLAALPAAAECTREKVRVDLPAQRMDERVQALAHLSGCFMEVDTSLLAGKQARRLKGRMIPRDALYRSLRGSGLEAARYKGHWRIDRRQQERFARRVATLRATTAEQRERDAISRLRAADVGHTLRHVEKAVPREVNEQAHLNVIDRIRYDEQLDRVARKIGTPPAPLALGWVAPVK